MLQNFRFALKFIRKFRTTQIVNGTNKKKDYRSAIIYQKPSILQQENKIKIYFPSFYRFTTSFLPSSFTQLHNWSTLRIPWRFGRTVTRISNPLSRLLFVSMGFCAFTFQHQQSATPSSPSSSSLFNTLSQRLNDTNLKLSDLIKETWNEAAMNEISTLTFINHFAKREILKNRKELQNQRYSIKGYCKSLADFSVEQYLAKGCDGAVFTASTKQKDIPLHSSLVVKLMFNYNDTNNSLLNLHNHFHHEVEPLRLSICHPNIVVQLHQLHDKMRDNLPGAEHFPEALSINCGAAFTKYIVMKRYDSTLDQILSQEESKCLKFYDIISILLQLLEAIIHLQKHGIAHRDIKLNNILVNRLFIDNKEYFHVSLCDFGHCVSGLNPLQMTMPFHDETISRGGNAALMAPEIFLAQPGLHSYLNYLKSDLWSIGTLVYNLLGMKNPFNDQFPLPKTYELNDLPNLSNVPSWFNQLIRKGFLSPSVEERCFPQECADFLNFYLIKSPKQTMENFLNENKKRRRDNSLQGNITWFLNQFLYIQQFNEFHWMLHCHFFSRVSSGCIFNGCSALDACDDNDDDVGEEEVEVEEGLF